MSPRTALRRLLLGLLLAAAAASPGVRAVEVELTAQYRGASGHTFEHTTPPSTACAFFPSTCRSRPSVTVPITYTKETAVVSNIRANFFLATPAPRTGRIYHEQTGEGHEIELSFQTASQQVASPTRSRNPASGRYKLNGSNCQIQTGAWRSALEYVTRWNLAAGTGACASRPDSSTVGQRETVEASALSLFYTLKLPSVFRLTPGRYRGSITYSVGAGSDFDFGDNVQALSDHEMTFAIVVDVEHSFRVQFAANTDLVTLEPPGGWVAWLDGGRIPPKLSAEVPLRLWSSGPFRIYKFCEYDVGANCGIRNRRGEDVPVQLAVTLPRYLTDFQGWQSINRRPIPTGRAAALRVEAQIFTANGPGQVHFEVAQTDLRPMLDRAGERYNGQVTVVFDAEL
ncbi:hypothetical protein [Pseudomonas sp.]|uniref:hypothetical protein n=1 Tax=Pseudomonas sp. TaxID=306 RepID=UPI0028ACF601|nr:hypothetical protein [Pseudomonas sp.]